MTARSAATHARDFAKRVVAEVPGVAAAVAWARRRRVARAASARGLAATFDARRVRLTKDRHAVVLATRHLLYATDVIDHFDEYWGAVEPVDVSGILTVDYSEPRLHRYAASGLEFWLTSFPEEPAAIEAYRHHYTPSAGDVVFDLGAYCGVSTYHFARWVGPTGRVFAFEPEPTNFEMLQRNIARHRLANVVAVRKAVAGRSGTRPFNVDASLGSSFADVLPRGVYAPTAQVQAVTLREVCIELGVAPHLVKMDVEGAEVEILRASLDFLRVHRCSFVVDTSHYVDGRRTESAVEALFREAGYGCASSERFGLMTTWAWPMPRSPGPTLADRTLSTVPHRGDA